MTTLTPKQEAFAQAYMQTGSASEAYRTAYDASKMKKETVHRSAQEMMSHPKVSARISELQQQARQRHKLTIDDLLKELEEARVIASTGERPQCGAMVQATMGKAKLLGFDTPKLETNTVQTYSFAVHRAGTELSND